MNLFFKPQYDLIAIGDTVTDAFIHLTDASAHVDVDNGTREICMRFGDKIPYDEVYVVPGVGNAANAAVAASRLGLKTAFVSNVGGDEHGREIIEVFRKESIATKFVRSHKGIPTNYHYVLWYGDERTILIKHQKYPYDLPNISEPKWIYLSSLGENSLPLHQKVEEYLQAHPNIKVAFQPGTYQMRFGKERLAGLYKRADIFFCNTDEARRILETEEKEPKKLLQMMHALGPKTVFITDGIKGAYAYDGKEAWFMRPYPDPKPPVQRTGAGDAFSSTVTVALLLGKNIREALRWGPINSMSVVQGIGARQGLLTREKLEKYLAKAPEDYHPKLI